MGGGSISIIQDKKKILYHILKLKNDLKAKQKVLEENFLLPCPFNILGFFPPFLEGSGY